MPFRRIPKRKEQPLSVHRWVVKIVDGNTKGKREDYKYFMTTKEVREFRQTLPVGSKMYVFKAVHNFKEAWEVV